MRFPYTTQQRRWRKVNSEKATKPCLESSRSRKTNEFISSHARQQHCTLLAEMPLRTVDHREQRPQLCGALTGELKTGPWAGNKTLERCRNSEHSSAVNTQQTVTPKWHCNHHHRRRYWPFCRLHETWLCSSGWNRRLLCLLSPKLVKCITAATQQCMKEWGEGNSVWFLLYLELLTHICCRVTKSNIKPVWAGCKQLLFSLSNFQRQTNRLPFIFKNNSKLCLDSKLIPFLWFHSDS